MGRKVYFPFGIVTLIQFLGNIFFAYQYIDINSTMFQNWVEMVDPIVSYIGVESGNLVSHKRFLAFFGGGMLPLISLSFLHMLVKFEEQDKFKKVDPSNIDELSIEAGKKEAKDIEDIEKSKYNPNQEEIDRLQKILNDMEKKKAEDNSGQSEINRLSYSGRNG
jgi:hypothetical protein